MYFHPSRPTAHTELYLEELNFPAVVNMQKQPCLRYSANAPMHVLHILICV